MNILRESTQIVMRAKAYPPKHIRSKDSILRFVSMIGVLLFCTPFALTQSDDRNFEIGGQISFAGVPSRTVAVNAGLNIATDREFVLGIGGRLGYNLSRHFSLEAEMNVFPQDRELDGGRKVHGVFGLKAGKRFEKVGIFAKARPGFVYSSRGNYLELNPSSFCGGIYPPPITCYAPSSTTNFALDLGGVLEVYPSKRTILRFDLGDTLIRSRDRFAAATQAGSNGSSRVVVIPVAGETTHNLQVGIGLGIRF